MINKKKEQGMKDVVEDIYDHSSYNYMNTDYYQE